MTTDTTAPEETEDDVETTDDFDAWSAAQRAKRGKGRTPTIFGRQVELPTSLPLGWTLEMEERRDSDDIDDMREMVGIIYGAEALDHWIAQDCDLEQFQVLMAYGYSYASGNREITFDRAAEMVREAGEGKEGNRAQRRAAAARKKKAKRGRPGGR